MAIFGRKARVGEVRPVKDMLDKASAVSIEAAGPGRIRIGRQQAALGLLWQPARAGMSVRDQAALAGSGTRVFGLVANSGDGRQLGFASADKGFASGMLAGATLFDGSIVGDTWAGGFSAGGGEWWIMAVRDGWIYEDLVCRDAESAEAAFRKLLEAPDWGRLYAPADWRVDGAEDASLAELIAPGAAARIRPLNRAFRFASAACAALLALALLGYGWREVSRLQHEWAQREALVGETSTAEVIPAPWMGALPIEQAVPRCENAMERFASEPPGWDLLRLECVFSKGGATVTADWRRTKGRISFLAASVESRAGIRPVLGRNGESASASDTFAIPEIVSEPVAAPWSGEKLETVLRERFQTLGLDLKLVRKSGRPNAALGGVAFNRHDIAVATSTGLQDYARLISDIPALVPESIMFDMNANAWMLKAKAYHRPPAFDADATASARASE